MNGKRTIWTLLLLAVYLMAVGGPAVSSLSCRCPHHVQAAQTGCSCGGDHAAVGELVADVERIAGCGCNHRHSTEITLYTYSPADGDRAIRCAVVELSPQMAAEAAAVPSPTLSDWEFASDCMLVAAAGIAVTVGLRAPPVLV